jgi:hypothetical protein
LKNLQNSHPSKKRLSPTIFATHFTTRCPQKNHPETPLFPKHPQKTQQKDKSPGTQASAPEPKFSTKSMLYREAF